MIPFSTVVRLIKANLTHRLLRTGLTLLGIVVGVASVFSLVTVGQGLEQAVTSQFADIGSNRLIVQPQGESATLNDDDVEVLERVSGIQRIAALGASTAQITWEEESAIATVIGSPSGEDGDLGRSTLGANLEEGRSPRTGERFVTVVGNAYVNGDQFDQNRRVGQDLTLRNESFEIIGVNEDLGNSADNQLVFVPIEQYQDLFDDEDYAYVIAETPRGADLQGFIDEIEKELRAFRDEDPGDETFSVETVQDQIDSFLGIITAVQTVVVSIAAISLVVGAIGVGNTMYTAVLERKRDIGVMKSIGAGRTDILWVFASESAFLGFVGGLLGVIAGFGLSEGIVYVGSQFLPEQFISVSYSSQLITATIVGSTLLGLVAGAVPTYRASRLDPVDALRTE